MPRTNQSPGDPHQGSSPSHPAPQKGLGQRPFAASLGLHLLVLGALVGWIPFVPYTATGTNQNKPATRVLPFQEPRPEVLELPPRPTETLAPLTETSDDSLEDLDALVFPEAEPPFPTEDLPAPRPRDLAPSAVPDPFAAADPHLRLTPELIPEVVEPEPEVPRGQEAQLAMPTEVAGECEAPRYPVWAARAKISAEVRLAITVGTDGNVRGVEIISSNGHRALIEQAARAVWSWRYSPAVRDGESVECVVRKTIVYVPDL